MVVPELVFTAVLCTKYDIPGTWQHENERYQVRIWCVHQDWYTPLIAPYGHVGQIQVSQREFGQPLLTRGDSLRRANALIYHERVLPT